MDSTLSFIRTVSVNRFKTLNGVDKINIINGKEGKKFFSCPEDTELRGAVSHTTDFSKPVVISTVVSTNDGAQFYLMHNQANNDANVAATL